MELKFLHLYDDAMNLYGEYANLLVLKKTLEEAGHMVSVDHLRLHETREISGYDLYFMGGGTEPRQKLALRALLSHKDTLVAAARAGKVLLFTGNAFDLLGLRITDKDGNSYPCLGIGNFESKEAPRRITGDCLALFQGQTQPVVGFINKCSKQIGITTPMFQLKMGFGNEADKGAEGFCFNHCYGTHVTGPLLVKNPGMLRLFVKLLTGDEAPKMPPYMEQSYETTARALERRLAQLSEK